MSLKFTWNTTFPFAVMNGLNTSPKLGTAGSGLIPSAIADSVRPSPTNTLVVGGGPLTTASNATSWRVFNLALMKEKEQVRSASGSRVARGGDDRVPYSGVGARGHLRGRQGRHR